MEEEEEEEEVEGLEEVTNLTSDDMSIGPEYSSDVPLGMFSRMTCGVGGMSWPTKP